MMSFVLHICDICGSKLEKRGLTLYLYGQITQSPEPKKHIDIQTKKN